jgi:hypothetical protein
MLRTQDFAAILKIPIAYFVGEKDLFCANVLSDFDKVQHRMLMHSMLYFLFLGMHMPLFYVKKTEVDSVLRVLHGSIGRQKATKKPLRWLKVKIADLTKMPNGLRLMKYGSPGRRHKPDSGQ